MKTKLVAAFAAMMLALLAFASIASAPAEDTSPAQAQTPQTVAPEQLRNGCGELFTQGEYRRNARRVYRKTRIRKASLKRLRTMRRCQHSDKAQRNVTRYTARLARARQARLMYARMGNRGIGLQILRRRGQGGQWPCLNALWSRESGWNHRAMNGSSGAYGIPQALPGRKMASHGRDWASNPSTQIRWGLDYIAGRYGTPCNANSRQRSQGWY